MKYYLKLKKIIDYSFIVLVLFLSTNTAHSRELHKVLKVIDGDTVYIDLNDDGCIQKDEKIRINGIDTFEIHRSEHLNRQAAWYNLTEDEALELGFWGKEYAKNHLLNKLVRAEYTANEMNDKYNRHLMSISVDKQDYAKGILKEGLAVVYYKSNISKELKPYENLSKMKSIIKSKTTKH